MANKDYCVRMARYNLWQNQLMSQAFHTVGQDALMVDRGAFFGSIFKTANHILWGNQLWVARFDGGEGMTKSTEDGLFLTETLDAWDQWRKRLDKRIFDWAEQVAPEALQGNLQWRTVAGGIDMDAPLAMCVTQMFNHQTHHRGQIHAMMTLAGHAGWVTDVPFIPAEATFD